MNVKPKIANLVYSLIYALTAGILAALSGATSGEMFIAGLIGYVYYEVIKRKDDEE